MYQVKTILTWDTEARAKIWCKENSILYRTEGIAPYLSYEETRDSDRTNKTTKYMLGVHHLSIRRTFYFKYEEDAILFKLMWS